MNVNKEKLLLFGLIFSLLTHPSFEFDRIVTSYNPLKRQTLTIFAKNTINDAIDSLVT